MKLDASQKIIEDEQLINNERINSDSSSNQENPWDKPLVDDQQIAIDIQQFQNDKKAIYKHPLFQLLGNY